ncbi:MAG: hypothetical protein ABSF98_28970 [Bryobacteraceae bacterium]
MASREEAPRDFAPADLPDFRRGLFLPRRDPYWLGRIPCPPRVLLLTDSTLAIVTHPSDPTAPVHIRLPAISSLETGNMMLLGWMEIGAGGAWHKVEYNTRCSGPIDDFRRELRRSIFEPVQPGCTEAVHFGDAFDDIKFSRAGAYELDQGENVAVTFLSLPRRRTSKHWLKLREAWQPGDLVICTDRRFLWITDRYNGRYERYGRVVRSLRRRDIRAVSMRREDRGAALSIRSDAHEWTIAVDDELEAAATEFAGAAHEPR